MKKDEFINAMLEIDDKYILAAAPGQPLAAAGASWVRVAAIAACMALIMIAAAVILPFSRRSDPPPETQPPAVSDPVTENSDPPITSDTPTDTAQVTTGEDTPPVTDPPITQPPETDPPVTTEDYGIPLVPFEWTGVRGKLYAVIELGEATGNTATGYMKSGRKQEYVEYKCKILYTNDPEQFASAENSIMQFCESDSIYLEANSLSDIIRYRYVLIRVNEVRSSRNEPHGLNKDEIFYAPYLSRLMSENFEKYENEFLPIVDGKLIVEEEELYQDAFYPFIELNYLISVYNKKNDEELNLLERSYPKKPLASGMTVDEIAEFFGELDELCRVYTKCLEEYRRMKAVLII